MHSTTFVHVTYILFQPGLSTFQPIFNSKKCLHALATKVVEMIGSRKFFLTSYTVDLQRNVIAIFRQRKAIGIQQSEFLIMFMLFVQCPKEVIVRLNFAFVWEWLSEEG